MSLIGEKINIPYIAFSLNPGIWDEFFFRGVLMLLLLGIIRDSKRSFLIQVALFSLMHIKGFGVWDIVDVFSVMLIGFLFTYTALKTRALVAGIVFHFVHDSLLFFVQAPSSVAFNNLQEVTFFGFLWLMIGVGCIVVRCAAERLDVRGDAFLYQAMETFQTGSQNWSQANPSLHKGC